MFTSKFLTPTSCISFAKVDAICDAAKGVLLRDPLNPKRPALEQNNLLGLQTAL